MNQIRSYKSIFSIMESNAKDTPLFFCMNMLMTLFNGLHTPVMILIVAEFIEQALTVGSTSYVQMHFILTGMLVVIGYGYTLVSQQFMSYIHKRMEDTLLLKLKPRMIEKVYALDYLVYDDATVHDLIHRVTDEAPKKFMMTQKTVCSLIVIFIQVLGTMVTLTPLINGHVAWILVALLPLIYYSIKGGKKVYEAEKRVALLTRKMNYLSEILTNRESSHERTLFGFTPFVNNKFKEAHLYRSNYNTVTLAKEVSRNKIINILLNILIIPLVVVMAYEVGQKQIGVGLFTSVLGALIILSKILSSQLSELFLNLASHQEYAKDLSCFSDLAEHDENISSDKEIQFKSLVIKNLYFRYPGQNTYTLKGVDLKLVQGKSYSLVGINGAGKTTLIKILTGLYRKYEGEIFLNHKNLKTYTYGELRQILSVVSQDFARYGISVKENIAFNQKKTIASIVEELELNDFIEHLPSKEETLLGKINDNGVDLSGGQWQKIAIARGLYRESPFIILDEPTASLSPTAESEIYEKFMVMAENQTMLMISHRLGSTKISDEIIVMNQGQIVEFGNHTALMKQQGLYAELYTKQSRLYHEI